MMLAVSQALGNEFEALKSQNGAKAQTRASSSDNHAYNHGGEIHPSISNEEQHSVEQKEVEVQKPQDDTVNGNVNENIPSDAESRQLDNFDDVYLGVSPPSKHQKVCLQSKT